MENDQGVRLNKKRKGKKEGRVSFSCLLQLQVSQSYQCCTVRWSVSAVWWVLVNRNTANMTKPTHTYGTHSEDIEWVNRIQEKLCLSELGLLSGEPTQSVLQAVQQCMVQLLTQGRWRCGCCSNWKCCSCWWLCWSCWNRTDHSRCFRYNKHWFCDWNVDRIRFLYLLVGLSGAANTGAGRCTQVKHEIASQRDDEHEAQCWYPDSANHDDPVSVGIKAGRDGHVLWDANVPTKCNSPRTQSVFLRIGLICSINILIVLVGLHPMEWITRLFNMQIWVEEEWLLFKVHNHK